MHYWRPIVTLLALSTLLTEILSGNLPVAGLAQPFVVFLFVTIGYGFPVLVLREIWVRKQFGLVQLFLLGVGYGIYNEGLYARTIFNPFHSPVDVMATYGLVGDVRIPWLLSIGSWHALFAVIFTIIIVHYFFPKDAAKPWISVQTAWLLGLVCVGVGVWRFLDPVAFVEQLSGGMPNLIFMFFCAVALWGVVMVLPSHPTVTVVGGVPSWKYFFTGVSLFLSLYLIPVLIAGLRVPVTIFTLYFAAITLFFGYIALRQQSITLSQAWRVALGGEVACALMVLFLAIFSGNIPLMVTSVLFTCLFTFLTFWRKT